MAYYQRDMLSIGTRKLLAQFLAQSMFSSASLQPFRQNLASIPYFNCVGLFRYLDQGKKGYLTYNDFRTALGDINQYYLKYGFSRIDTLKVGQISKIQFSSFLLPKQNLELKQLVAQRMSQPQFIQQPPTILEQLSLLGKMVERIILDEIQLITPLRKKLIKAQDYSIRGVLNAIDFNRHAFITSDDLYKFIRGEGIDIQQLHGIIIIEMYDSNLDGKLGLDQLRWAIEGLQNKQGSKYEKALEIGSSNIITNKRLHTKESKQNYPKKQRSKQKYFSKNKQQKVEKQKFVLKELPIQVINSLNLFKIKQKQVQQIDQALEKQQKTIDDQIQSEKIQALSQLKLKKQLIAEQKMKKQIQQKIISQQMLQKLRQQVAKEKLFQLQKQQAISREESKIQRQSLLKSSYIEPSFSHSFQQKFNIQSTRTVNDRFISSIQYDHMKNSLKQHLETTDYYLERSKKIRQQIKRQRDIERQIQDRFNSIDYGTFQKMQKSKVITSYPFYSPIKHNKQHLPTTGKDLNK